MNKVVCSWERKIFVLATSHNKFSINSRSFAYPIRHYCLSITLFLMFCFLFGFFFFMIICSGNGNTLLPSCVMEIF